MKRNITPKTCCQETYDGRRNVAKENKTDRMDKEKIKLFQKLSEDCIKKRVPYNQKRRGKMHGSGEFPNKNNSAKSVQKVNIL